MLVLLVAFVCSIALIIFGAMKSSDVYQGALAKAKTSSAVTQVLGSPIKDGLFLSGSTNVNGASGEANLAIPLSGPKGEGTLYVVATKSAGLWTYSSLILEVKQTKKRIDLLHGNK
jgi:hypothetical protein